MSHEPLVTITLKEYNALLEFRDTTYTKIYQRQELEQVGVNFPWKDIIETHKIQSGENTYTHTMSITKDENTNHDKKI